MEQVPQISAASTVELVNIPIDHIIANAPESLSQIPVEQSLSVSTDPIPESVSSNVIPEIIPITDSIPGEGTL